MNEQAKLLNSSVEVQLAKHFGAMQQDKAWMKQISHEFRRDGYFNFKNFSFLPKPILEKVHTEVHALLKRYSVRRDVTVASTGNTYRKMYNVNQPENAQGGHHYSG